MDISLRYVTRFVYATPVWESHNALRACPLDGDGQRLLSFELETIPEADVFTYVDHWGTRVDTFTILQAHQELVVTASARVETSPRPAPETASMDRLTDLDYRDMAWRFLQPTRHTNWSHELARVSKEAIDGAGDVVSAVTAVAELIRKELEYRPGATSIGIDVGRVWEQRVGVCQDFAHLGIAMLRSVGIGARYVSGYFYAADPSSPEGTGDDEIVVATHAWLEAAIPDWGWWAVDPTNESIVDDRHVKIGHGRDYDDVTPLRGVYYGESEHDLAAEVTMSTSDLTTRRLPPVEAAAQQADRQQ